MPPSRSARFRRCRSCGVRRPVVVDEVGVRVSGPRASGSALPTPRGTKTAVSGPISRVKTAPKLGPARRSTQAPKIRPVATRDQLVPRLGVDAAGRAAAALNEMLFCTGPKSGSPSSTIFARCQFSLNQPAVVAVDGQVEHQQPGIAVVSTPQRLPNSIAHCPFDGVELGLGGVLLRAPTRPRWSRYQSIVAARPASKSRVLGAQPSSVRSLRASRSRSAGRGRPVGDVVVRVARLAHQLAGSARRPPCCLFSPSAPIR